VTTIKTQENKEKQNKLLLIYASAHHTH